MISGLVGYHDVVVTSTDDMRIRATGVADDDTPVIILTHSSPLPSADDRSMLVRHARYLAAAPHAGVPRVVEVVDRPTRVAVVLAAPVGPTLAEWVRDIRRTRTEVVAVVASLAEASVSLHLAGLAVGALDAEQVVVHGDQAVAVEAAVDLRLDDPLFDQVTLARLARSMLDRHDSSTPLAPALDAVLAKAVASAPADRYPSMIGFAADLRYGCRFSWSDASGTSWVGGNRSRLRWEQSAAADAEHLELLSAAMDRAIAEQRPQVVAVRGPLGFGRSTLLRAFHERLREAGQLSGLAGFSVAKDDPPLVTPRLAFDQVFEQIMAERPHVLADLKGALSGLVEGVRAQAIDIVPWLTRVVDDADPVDGQTPTELTRVGDVGRLVRSILHEVATRCGGMALILDDAESADSSSLELLRLLAARQPVGPVLIVVGLRTNDDGSLPFERELRAIDGRASVTDLVLQPRSVAQIAERLAQETGAPFAVIEPLAHALHVHSAGVPSAVAQCTERLVAEGQLAVDPAQMAWVWSGKGLEGEWSQHLGGAARRQVAGVSPMSLRAIAAVAVAGRLATPSILARAVGDDVVDWTALLDDLCQRRLLTSPAHGRSWYSVRDVAIRGAVLDADPALPQALRSRIARAALDQAPRDAEGRPDPDDDELFEIVMLIDEHSRAAAVDLETYVALCGRAARVAHRRGAFDAALEVQLRAIGAVGEVGLVGPGGVSPALRDAAIELHLRAARNALIVERSDLADLLLDRVWGLQPTALQKVRAMAVLGSRWWTRQDSATGLAETKSILAELGYRLPAHPRPVHVLGELIRVRLTAGRRAPERFLDADEATDERARAALDAMVGAAHLAYVDEPLTHVLMVLKGFRITAKKGTAAGSAYFVAGYGLLWCALGRNIARGLRYGEVGMQMAERTGGEIRTMVRFAYEAFIHHWGAPLADTIEPLRSEHAASRAAGRGGFAHTALTFSLAHAALSSQHLHRLRAACDDAIEEFDRLGERSFGLRSRLVRQAVADLAGDPDTDPAAEVGAGQVLEGRWFSLTEWSQGRGTRGEFAVVVHTVASMVALASQQMEIVERHVQAARPLLRRAPGAAVVALHWYHAAVVAAHFGRSRDRRKAVHQLRRLTRHNERAWAHRLLLVEAMGAVRRSATVASTLFDRAGDAALDAGELADLALIRERQAMCAAAAGDHSAARRSWAAASQALRVWGADRCAARLEAEASASASGSVAASVSESGGDPVGERLSPTPPMDDMVIDRVQVEAASQWCVASVVVADLDRIVAAFGEEAGRDVVDDTRKVLRAWVGDGGIVRRSDDAGDTGRVHWAGRRAGSGGSDSLDAVRATLEQALAAPVGRRAGSAIQADRRVSELTVLSAATALARLRSN